MDLNVAAACSFAEWHTTMQASTSITSPGSTCPAAVAAGQVLPVSAARCAQTTSRAAARAAATSASSGSPT